MSTKKIFDYGTRNSFFAFAVILTLAFAVLSLTGCKDPIDGLDELNTLSGNISISPSGTVPVNTELTASYSGTETVTYQWYRDNTAISGETSVRYTPATAGSYTVMVSRAGYNSKTSAAVTVIASSSGGELIDLSGTVSISAEGGSFIINAKLTATYSGSETVTFQWKKNGENIEGATSSTYTPTTMGSYAVTVSATGYNPKTSAVVDVTDPSLSTLTGNITISPNTGVTINTELTATYSGSEAVSFQWKKDGVNAGTASTTNPNKHTPTDPGSYTVTVSASGYNSKTSNPVTVSALPPITSAEIEITAPVKDSAPSTTATGTGDFSLGTVSWSPADNPFKGGVVYTATVTLTANTGHTFTGLTTAKINGQTANVSNNTGAVVTLSHVFPATDTRIATALTIKTQPTKLTYTHGETLNLTGLVVTLTFDDHSSDDVAAANFAARNITADPSHGDHLVHLTHNGHPVKVEYGNLEKDTSNLTVSPKVITFTVDAIADVDYTGNAHEPAVTVKDGAATLALTTDYTVAYNDNINAGTATATIAGVGNYAGSTGTASFTINKATGEAITTAPTAATIDMNSITLNAVTAPANGQTVEYGMNTTNAAPSTGWQNSTTFSGLTAATQYYFFARSAANDNYNAGTASSGAEIATKQQATSTITFEQIAEEAPDIPGPALHRSSENGDTTATLTVTEAAQYSSIEWYIDGSLRRTGATLNLNAANYTVGSHTITLEVVKGGVRYNQTITFTVAN